MAKSADSRGLRDEMNVGPDPRSAHRLVPLGELGKFKVADGEPDIRGWAAYTSTGREIGRVSELLVDTDANEVVMLDIDLRRDDRHTLAPIRASWVDQATRRVVIDVAEVTTGDELPALRRGAVLSDAEVDDFDDRYRRAYARHLPEGEYSVRHGDDEELRFGRRGDDLVTPAPTQPPTPADATAVRKASPADIPVAPAGERDRRYVERRPVDAGSWKRGDDAGSTERTVRYPRVSEERVIDRRPIVEEVVVRRRESDAAEHDTLLNRDADRPRDVGEDVGDVDDRGHPRP